MPSTQESPFEIHMSCDACLNPIIYTERLSGDTFARFYIHTLTRNYCAHCAPLMGYHVENRILLRNQTQTISRN